jgi:hypothetical protein
VRFDNDFVFASGYEGKPRRGQIYFTSATGDQKIEEFQITVPAAAAEHIDAQIFYNGRPLEAAYAQKRLDSSLADLRERSKYRL